MRYGFDIFSYSLAESTRDLGFFIRPKKKTAYEMWLLYQRYTNEWVFWEVLPMSSLNQTLQRSNRLECLVITGWSHRDIECALLGHHTGSGGLVRKDDLLGTR